MNELIQSIFEKKYTQAKKELYDILESKKAARIQEAKKELASRIFTRPQE